MSHSWPVSYTHLQGEEEKNAADLITKMDLFGGDSKGLYLSLIHI